MSPHRSNRKGDLGNYRPVSSAADIDNIFLTEEGWVYRHFKGNPSDPSTRYWDEIIVSGQVDRDEERVSTNPIDYGSLIDNEPMLDTVNAKPRRYLGLGDSPEANSVDGYVSPHTGYGTKSGEIEFETVVDGVNRVIGATDGCFDYDYKHGTCYDDDGNSGGGGDGGGTIDPPPPVTGKVSINLIKVTNGDIKVGDNIEFEVQVIPEDGATDCNWKVAVATTTRFSGELASGSTNESITERFFAEATTSGTFNIEAIVIAKDTAGDDIFDTDTLLNVEVEEDIATGSCNVYFSNFPSGSDSYKLDYNQLWSVYANFELSDGATFTSLDLECSEPGAISIESVTEYHDWTPPSTAYMIKGQLAHGTHTLEATLKAEDTDGGELICKETVPITVYEKGELEIDYINLWPANYSPSPGDTFEVEVRSTKMVNVDRTTTNYYVESKVGNITVDKIGNTDITTYDYDVTKFLVTVADNADGECSITFRATGRTTSGNANVKSGQAVDKFTVAGVVVINPYFYNLKFGFLNSGEDFVDGGRLDTEPELENLGDEDQQVDDVPPMSVSYYQVFGADGTSVDDLSDFTYEYTPLFAGSSVGWLDGDAPANISHEGTTVYTRDNAPNLSYWKDPELKILYVEKYNVTFSYNQCIYKEAIEFWYDVSYTDSSNKDVSYIWTGKGGKQNINGGYTAFWDAFYTDEASDQALIDHTGVDGDTEFYIDPDKAWIDVYYQGLVTTNYDEVKAVIDTINSDDFVLAYEKDDYDPVWDKPTFHKKYSFQMKATASNGAFFEEDSTINARLLTHSHEEIPGRDKYTIEVKLGKTEMSDDLTTMTCDATVTVRYWNDPNDDQDKFVIRVSYGSAESCLDNYIYIDNEDHEFRVERPAQDIDDVQEFNMTLWHGSKPQSLPDWSYGDYHEIFANGVSWSEQPDHPWNNLTGLTPFVAKVKYDESTVSSSVGLKFDYHNEPATIYNKEFWRLKGDLSELSYKKDDINYITVWDDLSDTPKRIKINIDYYLENRDVFGSNPDRPFMQNRVSHPRLQIDVGNGYEDYDSQTFNEGDTFKIKVEIDRNPACEFTMDNIRFIGSLIGKSSGSSRLYHGEVTGTTTVTDDMIVGEFETTMINKEDKDVYFRSLILCEKVKAGEDTIRVAMPSIKTTNYL